MPYLGIQDGKLPSYVKKLSATNRRKWIEIFNSTYEKEGEKMAFIVANKWLDRNAKKRETVARSKDSLKRVTFLVQPEGEYIVRSENGQSFISAVLASTDKLVDGVAFSEETLKKWAEEINKDLPVGDMDHEFYNWALEHSLTDDELQDKIKKKPGIVKTVKALYDKGKLWLRLFVDKRYKKVIEKAKGLSVEAYIGEGIDPKFLGFTVCANEQQADPSAVIL